MNKSAVTTHHGVMPDTAFAGLGGGKVAYLRSFASEDVSGLFPGVPDIHPGLEIWALLSADGTPILLTDSRDAAIANARQNDLEMVAVH